MITIANLKRHFLKLCADEEAEVQWCDVPSKALALSGELEFILTPHIASEITYAVAMHELGHIKSRDRSGDQIERERAAWDWARHNALTWTPRMEGYAAASLRCREVRRRRQTSSM
jgi:broad specificity phosphatase PhoE